MDEAEAIRSFRQFIEQIDGRALQIESFCWFCDDFEMYKRSYVDEIENQINQTPLSSPRALYYYHLIDAMCNRCVPAYRSMFSELLPRLVQSTLHRCQEQKQPWLVDKLGKLIEHWSSEKVLNDDVLRPLQEALKEVTMPVVERREVAPRPQPVVLTAPAVVNTPETVGLSREETDEKRLARAWMRGQVDWETKVLPQPTLLEIDLEDTGKKVQAGNVSYVEITPDNERETCASCSGVFERALGPNGKQAFKGVTITEDGRYVHQSCYQLDTSSSKFRNVFA